MPEGETRTASPRGCFVIAPIGEPESDIRKRSDQVLKHIIQPAVKTLGYEAVRADQISEPGIITTQIIQRIIDDPLVVADLSGKNPNVMYELALRHALRKPYVQLIQKGERIPFDVAATRTVEVDHRDLDSVETAKAEIVRQIRTMESQGNDIDSPISVAIDLEALRQSGNPEQRQLADVLAAVSELRSGLAVLDVRLKDPAALLPPQYVRDLILPELKGALAEWIERTRRARASSPVMMEMMSQISRVSSLAESPGVTQSSERFEELKDHVRRLERFFQMYVLESGIASPEMLESIRSRKQG